MLDALSVEAFGQAPRWPASVPPGYAPREFEEVIAEVLRTCDVDGELVDVDCREPPCFAVVRDRGDAWSDISSCPAWREHFTRGYEIYSSTTSCGSRLEEVLMIAPVMKGLLQNPRPHDILNADKRKATRASDYVDSWSCAE